MRRGFTLLELSIVLAIIGMIAAGALSILVAATKSRQFNYTVEKMDVINKALLDYGVVFKRIPCPSSLTAPATDASYGVEAANKGGCTGGSPAATFTAASGTVEGGVPTRALQLPDDFMFDGWGRRFRYAVDPSVTADSSFPSPVGGLCSPSTKSVTVKDAAGANRTTAGIYALISNGANGHGAYTRNGVVYSSGSTNTDEQTNCHCDATGAATAYAASYVEKLPAEDVSNVLNSFDDIVTFRENWQIQTQNFELASKLDCVYIYVADSGYIEVFDGSGNYIRRFGGGQLGGGGNGLGVDSTGNIWVADYNRSLVQKFDIGGNFISSFGSAGSGNPPTLAVDSSNNIWVASVGRYIVQKFAPNGTQLLQIGTGSWSSGDSANGLFNGAWGVAVDASGNAWVTDSGNNRVQKFNSSGVWQQSYGGPGPQPSACTTSPAATPPACAAGTANGQFNEPLGIAVAPNGYIWVIERNNPRVQVFDSSFNFQFKFSLHAGSEGRRVSIDSGGNAYVSTYYPNELQKYSSTGTYVANIFSAGYPTNPAGVTFGR